MRPSASMANAENKESPGLGTGAFCWWGVRDIRVPGVSLAVSRPFPTTQGAVSHRTHYLLLGRERAKPASLTMS